jgi:hypothetical protein
MYKVIILTSLVIFFLIYTLIRLAIGILFGFYLGLKKKNASLSEKRFQNIYFKIPFYIGCFGVLLSILKFFYFFSFLWVLLAILFDIIFTIIIIFLFKKNLF